MEQVKNRNCGVTDTMQERGDGGGGSGYRDSDCSS